MTIVSHAYKFVFIKTAKTGGTAIETCLSEILPESDILSPFGREEEGHIARNYQNKKGDFRNHMHAQEVIKLLGNDYKDYFYWCVEREPVDKCLSHYAMLKNSPNHGKNLGELTWEAYLKRKKFPINSRQYYSRLHKLSFRKQILVDHIIDYHNIRETLPLFLREKFGIQDFNLNKSNAKAGFRDKSIPTIDEVSQEQRKLIYSKFVVSNKICREFGINYLLDSI